MAVSSPSLDVEPSQELQFTLSNAEATPKTTLYLRHPGKTQDALAFKVKTTQPRRYLVRPNQGLIQPGASESIQILLVEKDKNSLMQAYTRLGQTALDHSKDKFLVQSCVVSPAFAEAYTAGANDDGYDKLSSMWATVTSPNSGTAVANKKLSVKLTVADANATSGGAVPAETPSSPRADVKDMPKEQLQAEITNLRRKYDELVAFSVNLTAERDILNNTLEQTKRDLQRELQKNAGAANKGGVAGATQKAPPTSRSSRILLTILVAFLFFVMGVRMEAQGKTTKLKALPVVGGLLKTPSSSGGSPVEEKASEEL